MLQNYLKKNDSFVGGTLTGFFGMLTIIIIPNFVENYNLKITLEVFIFSIWFGILFYRHQLLKNNEWKIKSLFCSSQSRESSFVSDRKKPFLPYSNYFSFCFFIFYKHNSSTKRQHYRRNNLCYGVRGWPTYASRSRWNVSRLMTEMLG